MAFDWWPPDRWHRSLCLLQGIRIISCRLRQLLELADKQRVKRQQVRIRSGGPLRGKCPPWIVEGAACDSLKMQSASGVMGGIVVD
jgi:hypothetical protein